MELYACGFNAHGQLRSSSQKKDTEDLKNLQKIAEGKNIRIRCALWSATVIEIDGKLIFRGFHESGFTNCVINGPSTCDIKTIFGDTSGVLGALTVHGGIWTFGSTTQGLAFSKHEFSQDFFVIKQGLTIDHIAIAGNDQVCICTHPHPLNPVLEPTSPPKSLSHSTIHTFPSFSTLLSSKTPQTTHPLPTQTLTALLASATSFAALTTSQIVYTFGDARHSHLGRPATPSSPANIPSPLPFLGGIPIRKIATGGWISAAVSRDNDLYIWGGRPGEDKRIAGLPAGDEEVRLVDVEGSVDVVDVGVGAGYVVLVTAEGRVWSVGEGRSGQLGVGGREFEEEWVKMEGLGEGRGIGVETGESGTFVLVEKEVKGASS